MFSGQTPSLKITYLKEGELVIFWVCEAARGSPTKAAATPRPRNFTGFFATSGFNLLPTSSGGSFNETALQVKKESFFMKPVNPFLGA